jgi:hypothetical protein
MQPDTAECERRARVAFQRAGCSCPTPLQVRQLAQVVHDKATGMDISAEPSEQRRRQWWLEDWRETQPNGQEPTEQDWQLHLRLCAMSARERAAWVDTEIEKRGWRRFA